MEDTLPWFATMPPQPRSLVGLIIQAGIRGFADWLRSPGAGSRITADVFAVAPSDLASVVTLEQTVELVRIAVEVTESAVDELVAPAQQTWLREATLRYSREIAFAAALVYARAAEQRGAWDARLESLVVDAVVRGDVSDSLLSRASALGWTQPEQVIVVAGRAPDGDPERVLSHARHLGRASGADILAGVQTARLVMIVGAPSRLSRVTKALLPAFADGPVVTGPVVGGLVDAATSVQDVFAALRAAAAWPSAPRPVPSEDLLAERAIAGDIRAVRALVTDIYRQLETDPGPARHRGRLRTVRWSGRVDRPRAVRARQHGAIPASTDRRVMRPRSHRWSRSLCHPGRHDARPPRGQWAWFVGNSQKITPKDCGCRT